MNYSFKNINYKETVSYKEAVMLIHNANTENTLRNRLPYRDDTFPIGVRTDLYDYFINNTLKCHWHHDFEFGILLDGNVDYYINETHIELKKGDLYFVNSNILHTGRQTQNSKGAVMYSLTFPASILSADINGTFYAKYIYPMLNTKIEGFKISGENTAAYHIKAVLQKIYRENPYDFGYELKCAEYINRLWFLTLEYIKENKFNLISGVGDKRQTERIKEMLSYIHNHYNEKITVADISESVNVSRGECFRCFKHFMNKTIVEYINEYRLQKTAKLLRETEKNITDISMECGFDNASYFNKLFKKAYSMTPFQYRNARLWTENTFKNVNGYDYMFWKNSGSGTMLIAPNANNGSFICKWQYGQNIIFRSGKVFEKRDKTHKLVGNITLKFNVDIYEDNMSEGNTFLNVYGWTVDPLVEWYIVENYTLNNPANALTCLGTYTVDGSVYEIYRDIRTSETILGVNSTFDQYWSVRVSVRKNGTVNVSEHLHAWESIGLATGRITEISLSVEGWRSSGNAAVYTNILTVI